MARRGEEMGIFRNLKAVRNDAQRHTGPSHARLWQPSEEI